MSHLPLQNIKFDLIKLVIFDLDGTLADTSVGILNSHKQAHMAMGRPIPSDDVLYSVIGGPLLDTYQSVFHFSVGDATEAVRIYREWYSEYGIHQAKLYPGMNELLSKMRDSGLLTGIATLKAEQFAKIMMEELKVGSLFSFIYGMNAGDTLTKAQLIQKCMSAAAVKPEETCMIGDSIHDMKGAQQCNVPFIGVSYGFGFQKTDDLMFPLCGSSEDIARLLKL